jgi:hypothetical protein
MAVATNLRVAVPSALTGPAQISAEMTLAELQEIKAAWAALAADLGYLDNCWEVVRWLGEPVFCRGHNNLRLWRSQDGELAILGSENRKTFNPDEGAWHVERKIGVWLKNAVETARNQGVLRQTSSPVDKVLFSSRCVVRHAWTYYDVKSPILIPQEGTLFIPGQWIAKILAVTVDAKGAMMRTVFDAGESERKELLAELMVGQNV